jgi:hypothetical protein
LAYIGEAYRLNSQLNKASRIRIPHPISISRIRIPVGDMDMGCGCGIWIWIWELNREIKSKGTPREGLFFNS